MGLFGKKSDKKQSEDWFKKGGRTLAKGLSKKDRPDEETLKKALECFETAIELDPQNSSAWEHKGMVMSWRKDYEKSVSCYQETINLMGIDDVDPSVWMQLSISLKNLGRDEEVEECLTHLTYDDRKKIEFALISIVSPLVSKYQAGKQLAEGENYELAIKFFDEALDINPQHLESLFSKALSLYNLERFDESVSWYLEMIKLDPHNSEALNNICFSLLAQDKLEEAIVYLDKVIEMQPTNWSQMNNKSAALGKLGRYEESIECIDAVLKANPKYVEAWHNKGKTLQKLGRDEEAEECFAESKKLDES